MRKFLLALAVALALSGAPMVVSAQSVVITVAPPPLQFEAPPVRPGPSHIWQPGYWAWNGHQHIWTAGRWALPPAVSAVWVPPTWSNRAGLWAYNPGQWRNQSGAVLIPPPPAGIGRPAHLFVAWPNRNPEPAPVFHIFSPRHGRHPGHPVRRLR